jgi:hypothetical protein
MENKSSAVNMNIPDQRQVLPRQGLYLTEAYRSAAGLAGRLTDLLVLVKVMSELDLPFSLVSQSHGETGIGALLAAKASWKKVGETAIGAALHGPKEEDPFGS